MSQGWHITGAGVLQGGGGLGNSCCLLYNPGLGWPRLAWSFPGAVGRGDPTRMQAMLVHHSRKLNS